MSRAVAVALVLVLAALAALHLYWGLGGRWPGTDEASLVARVVGRTPGMRAPGPLACALVAGALATAAALVFAQARGGWPAPVGSMIALGFWTAALVFAARGAAGFVPAVTRYAEGTPFHALNLWLYSPLCLAIAAGFAYVGARR